MSDNISLGYLKFFLLKTDFFIACSALPTCFSGRKDFLGCNLPIKLSRQHWCAQSRTAFMARFFSISMDTNKVISIKSYLIFVRHCKKFGTSKKHPFFEPSSAFVLKKFLGKYKMIAYIIKSLFSYRSSTLWWFMQN
jgi:hypothetical protein